MIARPMIGSAICAPSPTTAALATTPSETKPSMRAWLPSAISAALASRRPAAQAHLRRELVADEADDAGRRERPEMRQVLRDG